MNTPPRFIVVDDDPVNNMLSKFVLHRVLATADIKVFTVPEDALAMIVSDYAYPGDRIPTILFLDINMPSMTGWEFVDIFKAYDDYIRSQFRIFIVSSSVDSRDKERAEITEHVHGFLSKPLKAEVIQRILSE